MNKKLAIIGAGGHGKVVGEIALLNNYRSIFFFDDNFDKIENYPFKITNNLDYLNDHLNDYDDYFVAIGNNKLRSKKHLWLKREKMHLISLFHPKAVISKFSNIGIGTCVMANAVINADTKINEGVIINTSASIDHDCYLEDFVHISPNCSLSGGISIGKFSHLGSGTSVHPYVQIGENVKTGVGSKIYKNILNDITYND